MHNWTRRFFLAATVLVATVFLVIAVSLSQYPANGYTVWTDAPDALEQLIAERESLPVSDIIIHEKTVLTDRIFVCWEDRSLSAVRMTWFETTKDLFGKPYIRIHGGSKSSAAFSVHRLTGNWDGTGDQSLFVVYGDNRQIQAAQYSFVCTPAKEPDLYTYYKSTVDYDIHAYRESLSGDFLLKVVLLPGIYQCSAVDLLNISGDLLLTFS